MDFLQHAEEKIGYHFQKREWLERALSHSSYANEKHCRSNERLEFLGDSVLSVIVSDYIFKKLDKVDEGYLTKTRATLVCEHSLAEIAKDIDLGNLIFLGKGEEMTGGRTRASIVSDAFEALLAAIYLDGGIEAARGWLLNLMEKRIEEAIQGGSFHDYKTMLQEMVQKDGQRKVSYRMVKESGLDHHKSFSVQVMIDGRVICGGEGSSKKEAEQNAAKGAIEKIEK